MKQETSVCTQMSQKHETHLVGVQSNTHMSRTALEIRQICQADAGIATALETTRERLQTKWKSSGRAKTVQNRDTLVRLSMEKS